MDLSVIILSYNTREIIDECLRRLQVAVKRVQGTGYRVQTIVLDNASDDESARMIRENHPWVELIESKENTGFSKGNNIAAKKSKGDFILFLNSDAFVEEDTLSQALDFFKKHPEADVLGCKLKFKDGNLQPSAGYLPNILNTLTWQLGIKALPFAGNIIGAIHPRNVSFFNKTKRVEWVMGAFFMMKRKVYEDVDLFDENLFMYAEEIELCFRIKKAGYKIFYTPSFSIIHLTGASSGFKSQKALYMEIKSMLYIFKKYYPYKFPVFKFYMFLGCMIRIVLFTLILRFQRRQAYIDALKLF